MSGRANQKSTRRKLEKVTDRLSASICNTIDIALELDEVAKLERGGVFLPDPGSERWRPPGNRPRGPPAGASPAQARGRARPAAQHAGARGAGAGDGRWLRPGRPYPCFAS